MSYFSNFQVSSFQDVKSGEDTSPPVVKKHLMKLRSNLDGSKVLEDPLFSFTMVLRSPKGLLFVSIRASEADPFHEWGSSRANDLQGLQHFGDRNPFALHPIFLNLSNHLSVLGNFWGFWNSRHFQVFDSMEFFGIWDPKKQQVMGFWSSLGQDDQIL